MENFQKATEWDDESVQNASAQVDQEQPTDIETKNSDEILEQRKREFIRGFIEKYEDDLRFRNTPPRRPSYAEETDGEFSGRSILISDIMDKYAKAEDEESEQRLRGDLEILKNPLTIEEAYNDIIDINDPDIIDYDKIPEGEDTIEYAIGQETNKKSIAKAVKRVFLADQAKMRYLRVKNYILRCEKKAAERGYDDDGNFIPDIEDFWFEPSSFKFDHPNMFKTDTE